MALDPSRQIVPINSTLLLYFPGCDPDLQTGDVLQWLEKFFKDVPSCEIFRGSHNKANGYAVVRLWRILDHVELDEICRMRYKGKRPSAKLVENEGELGKWLSSYAEMMYSKLPKEVPVFLPIAFFFGFKGNLADLKSKCISRLAKGTDVSRAVVDEKSVVSMKLKSDDDLTAIVRTFDETDWEGSKIRVVGSYSHSLSKCFLFKQLDSLNKFAENLSIFGWIEYQFILNSELYVRMSDIEEARRAVAVINGFFGKRNFIVARIIEGRFFELKRKQSEH
jgi:hypothetical protein